MTIYRGLIINDFRIPHYCYRACFDELLCLCSLLIVLVSMLLVPVDIYIYFFVFELLSVTMRAMYNSLTDLIEMLYPSSVMFLLD